MKTNIMRIPERLVLSLAIALLPSACAFKTPMTATMTGDGKYWVMQKPLVYEHPVSKREIVVPAGFVTDLASVPRVFWMAFPPCGKYTPAAVVHDYLYWEQPEWCSREAADEVLLKAMAESGVGWGTRTSIHRSVRAGGGRSWDTNGKLKRSGTIRFVPPGQMGFAPTDTWNEIEKRIRAAGNSGQN
jgi:hypothetical protein